MGSPLDEPGRRDWESEPARREIPYRFSISTTEVTREQFERLAPDHVSDPRWSSRLDCPVGRVVWLMAAAYCNSLSELEGLPESEWCYSIDLESPTPVPGYLTKKGYRLPTDAEWEYACRAGTMTSRYFGTSEDLLPRYAWYSQTPAVSQPVALLKPIDFGLFDMYGNAWEWCSSFVPKDWQENVAVAATDHIPPGHTLFDMWGVLRSETVEDEALNMRSAMRTFFRTGLDDLNSATGFRVARTEPAQ
jgi:formylglycine-generating enzyme required for sulfatase activity